VKTPLLTMLMLLKKQLRKPSIKKRWLKKPSIKKRWLRKKSLKNSASAHKMIKIFPLTTCLNSMVITTLLAHSNKSRMNTLMWLKFGHTLLLILIMVAMCWLWFTPIREAKYKSSKLHYSEVTRLQPQFVIHWTIGIGESIDAMSLSL